MRFPLTRVAVAQLSRALGLLTALCPPACARPSAQEPPSTQSTPASKANAMTETPAWSPVVDGLRIQAVAPTTLVKPGESVAVTLRFENTGAEPRRLYLLRSEPFRAMQSSFFLELGAAGFSIQPEPRPHGIVVTEADFHALAPGQTLDFTQTLRLPADIAPGTYAVRWQYENRVEQWQGGVQTLDGPTKTLFGGGPIPGIWRGKVETRFDVIVGRR